MSVPQSLMLAAVVLFTSAISVVTGSTSVITVPVMFQAGSDPRYRDEHVRLDLHEH